MELFFHSHLTSIFLVFTFFKNYSVREFREATWMFMLESFTLQEGILVRDKTLKILKMNSGKVSLCFGRDLLPS